MADNVKQHIVPRFYVAFFYADGDEKIFVRVRGSESIFLKSPSGQGYEKEAFTVVNSGERDTSCDNANKNIEDWCAPRLAALNGADLPTDDQWQAIFFFTANIISRSRRARDCVIEKLKQVQQALPKIVESSKERPLHPDAIRPFELMPDELNDLPDVLARAVEVLYPLTAARGAKPIAEELKNGKNCDLLVAPGNSVFISSDEPALILDGCKPVIMKLASGFLAAPAIEVYMPLKPNLACLWSPMSRRIIRVVIAVEVAWYNRMLWENCYERAFASRSEELKQF